MTVGTVVIVGVFMSCVSSYGLGFLTAMSRVRQRVFRPWLDEIQPGDDDFWPRAKEYRKRWEAYVGCTPILSRLPALHVRDDAPLSPSGTPADG